MIVGLLGCDGRRDIIDGLRENFEIGHEEATDDQLEQFLDDENNLLFAEAMLDQVRHGQEIERFLGGDSLAELPNLKGECLNYLAKKSVIGALQATGIPFLEATAPLIGVLSTISEGVDVYLSFAEVLQERDKRVVMFEYVSRREEGYSQGEVFKDIYEHYQPSIRMIILLSKGLSVVGEMEVTEQDKQDLATYLEFCYQSWKLATDAEQKREVKDYILSEIAILTLAPSSTWEKLWRKISAGVGSRWDTVWTGLQEWFDELWRQISTKLNETWEGLLQRLEEWLQRELERRLLDLLDTQLHQCCGANILAPATLFLAAVGINRKRCRKTKNRDRD